MARQSRRITRSCLGFFVDAACSKCTTVFSKTPCARTQCTRRCQGAARPREPHTKVRLKLPTTPHHSHTEAYTTTFHPLAYAHSLSLESATRINCKIVGQAAAAQCFATALATALAEATLRANGIQVVTCSQATNAFDPCLFAQCASWRRTTRHWEKEDPPSVAIVSTNELVYSAKPTKLGYECIVSAGTTLAQGEIAGQLLSACVPCPPFMLRHICEAVVDGGYVAEPMWASIVLVVFACSDPRTRELLRSRTRLTDIDIQTAFVLEAYGRAEITRRARLHMSTRTSFGRMENDDESGHVGMKRKQSAVRDPTSGLEIEDDSASIVNDSSDDDACFSQAELMCAMADDDSVRILAANRRRSTRGASASAAVDGYAVISWWYRALRCQHRSVLQTLVAADQARVDQAAQDTLARQDEGSGASKDTEVEHLARSSARSSSEALTTFVHRTSKEAPAWTRLSTQRYGHAATVAVGLVRVPAQTALLDLHACQLAPVACQPPPCEWRVPATLLWSNACQTLSRCDEDAVGGNVLEAYEAMGRAETNTRIVGDRLLRRMQRASDGHGHVPHSSTDGGVTRSVVAFRSRVYVTRETVAAAAALAAEGRTANAAQPTDSMLFPANGALLHERCIPATNRLEPSCAPTSRLTIGLRMCELLRRLMRGRTRKNDHCRVPLLPSEFAEPSRDMPLVMDSEPLPVAFITDFDVRCGDREAAAICGTQLPTTAVIDANMTVHLCLDGAVRAVEIIEWFASAEADATGVSVPLWPQRGVLYTGASHAAYVGELGASVSGSAANANISMSKRIATADVNTLCLLSIWDVLGGGITNLRPRFSNTPYMGTYGPNLDTGLTSVGLAGHNVSSDQRGHGSMTLSTEVADELAVALATACIVPCGDETYAVTPGAAQGIPHSYVPGLHGVLEHTVKALLHFYKTEREDAPVVHGLFVVPFSPFTQALRPNVECTADPTMRHCFRDPSQLSTVTGRSYLPDSTEEEEAIVVEPLWRRPAQVTSDDNPFATSYEYVEGLFNAMNTVAVVAKLCGGVHALHELICRWHTEDDGACASNGAGGLGYHYQWAADVCVLIFGAIYPQTHTVADECVPACYARACAAHARAAHKNSNHVPGSAPDTRLDLGALLADHPTLLAQARRLWARFSTRPASKCPWQRGIAPMLYAILDVQGSHDVRASDIRRFRTCIDRLASEAAWLAYSEDGVTPPPPPNPANECRTPADVRAPTIDPVFAARGDELEHDARACLVGLKPFQLRQLYALLLGAHREGVVVQVVRNEGGLLLRESALPTVLKQNGQKRSSKGIAPTQTESDSAAYGTRKAKCLGAAKQQRAWDLNALLQKPLYTWCLPPRSRVERRQGEYGDGDALRTHNTGDAATGLPSPTETFARNALRRAAASELATDITTCAAIRVERE